MCILLIRPHYVVIYIYMYIGYFIEGSPSKISIVQVEHVFLLVDAQRSPFSGSTCQHKVTGLYRAPKVMTAGQGSCVHANRE